VDEAITQINDFVQSKNRQLNFSIDEDSGRQVVKVTDAGSGDVIRQIPTPEVLKLSARIQELQSDLGSAVGLFFDNQA
jgi:flagellar protein FlaG